MPRALKPGRQASTPRLTPNVMVPRLPPGSIKHHEWNGKEWVGAFTVLDSPIFESRNRNEIKNLHALDRLYRLWVEQQSAEVQKRHYEHLK